MIGVGYFSEMKLSSFNSGSIHDNLTESVNYDKDLMIKYLQSFKHFSSCGRNAIDCVTGETISPSFLVYNDGEYCWCDFLIYHIKKYNIRLPQGLIDKAYAKKPAQQ